MRRNLIALPNPAPARRAMREDMMLMIRPGQRERDVRNQKFVFKWRPPPTTPSREAGMMSVSGPTLKTGNPLLFALCREACRPRRAQL